MVSIIGSSSILPGGTWLRGQKEHVVVLERLQHLPAQNIPKLLRLVVRLGSNDAAGQEPSAIVASVFP